MRATHQAGHRCAHNADHLAHDTPLSAFVAEVVCTLGATPPRTKTSPPRTATSPPPNRGNCTMRGARSSSAHVEGITKRGELHHERCTVELGPRRGRRQTGGNYSIRGSTRRRHAVMRLLMVQNPHHYPWCHAPPLVQCTLTDAGLPCQAPINARKASPTGPCCTGACRAGCR